MSVTHEHCTDTKDKGRGLLPVGSMVREKGLSDDVAFELRSEGREETKVPQKVEGTEFPKREHQVLNVLTLVWAQYIVGKQRSASKTGAQ